MDEMNHKTRAPPVSPGRRKDCNACGRDLLTNKKSRDMMLERNNSVINETEKSKNIHIVVIF